MSDFRHQVSIPEVVLLVVLIAVTLYGGWVAFL